MNEMADVAALTRAFGDALPTLENIAALSPAECLAAMRDLGMYLGSLQRHGISAFDVLPHATRPFELLGHRTRMIPRDTVFHYSCWNPVGERERLFTGHPMERSLIEAVRSCVPDLGHAVEIARSLLDDDPASSLHAGKMAVLARHITAADRAMAGIIRQVTPAFFAQVLRPYFEDIRISGRRYMGPAAANIPLFLVDMLLWASDHGSEEYSAFCREVASQTLPHWQARFAEATTMPSLASRIAAALAGDRSAAGAANLQNSAQSLLMALRSLISFRGKHLTMARRAYHEDLRLYPLGSGGGSVGLLEEILHLTQQNGAMISAVAAR
ncbi:monodechloroaminopyrrolnitrin synthase PrnB family protein [Micromonospora sp. NPDC050417]|uniref:monodechloroaminopyrrolnitrin synthase PrnB family protein n=1 Tax=Micromonospora sp. NPDC050417 TaxID=3364280 RepID=UPI0037895C15